jgi:hypothetical protein
LLCHPWGFCKHGFDSWVWIKLSTACFLCVSCVALTSTTVLRHLHEFLGRKNLWQTEKKSLRIYWPCLPRQEGYCV